jgi:hypothetical protein
MSKRKVSHPKTETTDTHSALEILFAEADKNHRLAEDSKGKPETLLNLLGKGCENLSPRECVRFKRLLVWVMVHEDLQKAGLKVSFNPQNLRDILKGLDATLSLIPHTVANRDMGELDKRRKSQQKGAQARKKNAAPVHQRIREYRKQGFSPKIIQKKIKEDFPNQNLPSRAVIYKIK